MQGSKLFFAALAFVLLQSCEAVNFGGYSPVYTDPNTASPETEREFQELSKTYKKETAAVLNDLLNDDPSSPATSVVFRNESPCNMVITVITNDGFYKKIPVAAGKPGYVMLQKNKYYTFSGMVCKAQYRSTKYVDNSLSVTLNNSSK